MGITFDKLHASCRLGRFFIKNGLLYKEALKSDGDKKLKVWYLMSLIIE